MPNSVHAGALATRLVRLITARPRLVLGATLALLALAGWQASTLRLETSFAALLPDRDPAVVTLHEMDRRIAAISTVIVVVQSPDPRANRRFVDALVPRLRRLHLPAIAAVQPGVHQARRFFKRHRHLYAPLGDLSQAERRLRMEVAKHKNPFIVDLESDGTSAEALLKRLEQKARGGRWARLPGGYFALPDRTLYAVVVWVKRSPLGGGGAEVARRVRETAERLRAERGPGLSVGYTGNVITAMEERHALADDLVLATAASVLLVGLVVWIFFRRLWILPLTVLPALGGVTVALAFAARLFGQLNVSTAFLGAIIVGNGINYAIIQAARYEEERRRGRGVAVAAAVSISQTWRATAIAALGAAIAYGSLAITSFRGFKQFGYIGGVGMLTSWLLTLLLLPALWQLLDRRTAPASPARPRRSLLAPLARLTERRSAWLVAGGVGLALLALLLLPRYARDPFEYDFRKLRTGSARAAAAEGLSAKLNPIFGRDLSPGFILADSVDQAAQIRRRLLARDEHFHLLGRVRTIHDLLPGSPEVQRRKLAVLGRIRRLIDHNAALLDPPLRKRLAEVRPPPGLHEVRPSDLPLSLRRLFTEKDGAVGRMVLYFPRTDITVWDGRVQLRLANEVQELQLADGETVRSSGPAVIFAAMLRAIIRDAPVVTAAALLGVALVVILLARSLRGALLVLGVLLFGVVWTVGAAAAAGVRVNFLNFVALPITFGIGVDYGVNLYLRYRQEGPGGVGPTVAATGGAVALCSLTTIIGYGALLVADSHALRSFGALAILGEVACILAALLLLPALALLLEPRTVGCQLNRRQRAR